MSRWCSSWSSPREARWRAITGAHLVPLVRAGARFENGILVERPEAAAARPGVLERSQATPVGVATGVERLQWRIVDLLAHGWDLVQATGVVAELPEDLVEQALTFVRAQLPSQPRAGRFADPQPIRDNAPAIDRLAAFTGRPVPWTP